MPKLSVAPGERLVALAQHALELMSEVTKKEEELAKVKAALDRVQRTDMPELLKELGMTDATLKDLGVKIALTQGVEASIPEAARADAFAWLAEKGYGALVRAEVSVLFGAAELEKAQQCAATLTAKEYLPLVAMSVPAPTLKAFAKESIAKGVDLPPHLFNVRAYDVCRITAIKKKG